MHQFVNHPLEPPALDHLNRQRLVVKRHVIQLSLQLRLDGVGIGLACHHVDAAQQLLALGLTQREEGLECVLQLGVRRRCGRLLEPSGRGFDIAPLGLRDQR